MVEKSVLLEKVCSKIYILEVYKLIREQSASGQRKKQLTIF
jgi:hypothetical protein